MSRTRLSYWPILILVLLGCRKDIEEFQPYAPSAQALGNLLSEQVPSASSQSTFLLNYLSADQMLETPNGTRIFLLDPDHLFVDANTGNSVPCSTCQELKIEVTEVMNKRDILARGLNTVGDSGTLFESGGMIRIVASCSGQALALASDRNLKIQIPNSNQQSDFFVYNQSSPTQWTKNTQEVFEAEWPVSGGTQLGYELLTKRLDWIACGRPLKNPTSNLYLELPTGFADQNTLAYMVIKNLQIVAPLKYDLGKNKFFMPKAPVGFQVQLLAVSKLGEQYWLGKTETEIGTNATIPLSTQQMTETAVLNFLKSI